MSDYPAYVRYAERLLPDADGNPTLLDVEIPAIRDDAFDAVRTLEHLFVSDRAAWKLKYRALTATSWYTLGLLLSGGQRLDPFTGRVEMDHPFLWEHFHELQFRGDRKLDKSARGHWKTHIRAYVGLTNRVCLDPNLVAAIVAHEKQAAFKHAYRTAMEWAQNAWLRLAWDDVFYADPENESPLWNKDTGWLVRRTIPSSLPTLSYYAIMEAPTGGRVGLYIPDDVEDEKTVDTEDQRKKLLSRFVSFLDTAGRLPEIWPNGTCFHPNGLVSHLERSGAFDVICHPAEDITLPAPDIAALYDACGGKLPDGRELPKKLRDIRLDGAAVFLHPLELALKRLTSQLEPGGLANYYRQYMGDATAGLEHKLDARHIRPYRESAEDRALGSNLVMTIDGSKGINDPTAALVWALHSDESISLVAGLRKKLKASEFGRAIFNLWSDWEGLGVFDQIRIELFGQAAYDWMIQSYFQSRHKDPPRLIPVAQSHRNDKLSGRKREYDQIEPILRMGKIWMPGAPELDASGKVTGWVGGILTEDEEGVPFDLCDYAIREEIIPFPALGRDDVIASLALLGLRADAKIEGGKAFVGPLPYPDSEADWHIKERQKGRVGRPSEEKPWVDDAWWNESSGMEN